MPGTQPPRGTSGGKPSKKRKVEDAFNFVFAQKTLLATHSEADAAGWSASQLADQIGDTKLPILDSGSLVSQYRHTEPSILETTDGRVNWCMPDPARTAASGFLMKLFANRASVDAAANTLLDIAKTHDAPFLHFHVEPEATWVGVRHRKQVAHLTKSAAAQNPITDSMPNVKICAHCNTPGHVAHECAMPDLTTGCIMPCALCNTKAHTLDHCIITKDKSTADKDFLMAISDIVLVRRAHMPQIWSTQWAFYDLLAIGADQGLLEASPSTVLLWPWSNEGGFVGFPKWRRLPRTHPALQEPSSGPRPTEIEAGRADIAGCE
ncbi:hypothetical protein C8A01DRAFT_20964 [Parachaetomium inaequale]|uniref:CCHC-type domain-containing protein n=1 Tax=Parachaetomium inaequale TaxID=2588326 RepID=A0AAN6SLN0_9PEZI|nr:hypothetical protein C8A01DRAFT_20964 [Parachaetomium inaequale]